MRYDIVIPAKTMTVDVDEEFFADLLDNESPLPEELAEMVGDILFCASDYGDQTQRDQFKDQLRNIIADSEDMTDFYKGVFDV